MTEQIRPEESGPSFLQPPAGCAPSFLPEECGKGRGGPCRVAAYIRVSTEQENQEDSYELQYQYFTGLLAENPEWISAGIYSDYGKSGTSREHRRGFNRLLRHCREGRIDHIVTKSISRFARNTLDFLKALEVLKDNHVTIAFEKEHLDTSVAQNDLMVTSFGAFAQEESRSIGENVRQSLRHRYSRGESPNIPVYGYRYAEGGNARETLESGYTRRRVEVVHEEAEVVFRIFREAANGKGYTEIARELNLDGIPGPGGRCLPAEERLAGRLKEGLDEGWTDWHVRRILRQERYCGDVLLQKTYRPDYRSHCSRPNRGELPQYYVQDHHPAIVGRELYEEAKKCRPARCGTGRKKTSYPFSGRLLCAHCGRYYSTRNRSSRPIWYCTSTGRNTGKKICCAERIYEEQLIRACRRAIIERFGLVRGKWIDEALIDTGIRSGTDSIYTSVDINFAAGSQNMIQDLLHRLIWLEQSDDLERLAFLRGQRGNAENRGKEPNNKCSAQEAGMEKYWNDLEDDYEWRQQAIAWMQTLPPGQEGVPAFLNGLTDRYVKAFILGLEVWSPLRYRVHWFDNTWTEVEMYSNVE